MVRSTFRLWPAGTNKLETKLKTIKITNYKGIQFKKIKAIWWNVYVIWCFGWKISEKSVYILWIQHWMLTQMCFEGKVGSGNKFTEYTKLYPFFRISYICMRRYTFFSRCYCGHWLVVEAHHRWLIVAPLIPEGENAQLQCSVFVLVSGSVFLGEDLEYFAFVSAIASVF